MLTYLKYPFLMDKNCFQISWKLSEIRLCIYVSASQVVLVVKNLPASIGDTRDSDSLPRSGRSPREGNGNPLQYSSLKNSMGRGSWWTHQEPWSHKESDTTEHTCIHTHTYMFKKLKKIPRLRKETKTFSRNKKHSC